jgi:hypothetical protein
MDRDILEQPFPSELLRTRKGSFGQTFTYVEGAEYIRRLNDAFESNWSFEIIEHTIRDSEVIVIGKLTIAEVTKMSFGGSSITVSREGEVISIADDLKAAATDALKKAASLLGVGLHLYSSEQPTGSKRPAGRGRNGKSNGNGRQNGEHSRRDGNVPTNGNRLTQRQLSAIWSMGRSLGLSADQIRERTTSVHGVQPEHLSKSDASSLIAELGEGLSGAA